MINVTQNGNVYEISFKFDRNVIEGIKSVPGRRWEPEAKVWTIPLDRLGMLIKAFEGTDYENAFLIKSNEYINQNEPLETTTYIPNIDISDVTYHVKEGSTPYKHQLDFMKWAIQRQNRGNMRGFLLCDDQGLAKTNESMNLAIYNKQRYNFKHCLIICCINSSKYNWKDDIADHTRDQYIPYIIGDRYKRNGDIKPGAGVDKLYDITTQTSYKSDGELPYFCVINIESLRMKSGKKYPIVDALINLINDGFFNMVIIDEVHKNMSPKSLQGQQLLRLKKSTGNKAMWIPMTGTPITSKPTDVFTPLRLIDSHNYTSYYMWCNQFCVYGGFGDVEIIGYKNMNKIKSMLSVDMIRRLKSDVLDLPPKIRYDEYVDNTPYQNKLYTQVAAEFENQADNLLMSPNPLNMLLRLRQVNGYPEAVDETLAIDNNYLSRNAKMKRLLELVDEILERGEKVVIFSNWVESLRTIHTLLSKKHKVCIFTGTMKVLDREKHKKAFMENPNYKILLGTIGAAGTAHTFTAANNIIFYDEPWTPSDKEQAEDRIYRVGTTRSVNIYTLLSRNTVDDKVHKILYKRSTISKYLIDNKLDLYKNRDLLDWIIS